MWASDRSTPRSGLPNHCDLDVRAGRVSQFLRTLSAVIVWGLLGIVGNGAGAQSVFDSGRTIEVEPLYDVQAQPVEERRWAKVKLTRVFSVSKGKDYFLYSADQAHRDSAGHFYVLDREDRRVKVFDAEGNYVRAIGNGRGAGPAEFQWPIDFAVTPDGEVWVIDAHRRKLSRFSGDGSLLKTFSLEGTASPKSIALTGEGHAIVLAHGPEPIFRKWSPDGTMLRQFGSLIRNQRRAFVALDGMVRSGPNGFVFAPNRTSHLLRFSADSTLRYAVETMDDVPYPNVTYSPGRLRLDPIRRLSTLSVAVANGNIYYYSYRASDASNRVIDVFRYADGRYRYSFKLPIEFGEVAMTENYLMGVGGSKMTVWRWERETTP